MAMTVDDLLDTILARYCGECGEELPRRGDQCPACAALPEETRAEAEERLRTDRAAFAAAEAKVVLGVVAAEAARFREDAEEHRRQMRESYAAADLAELIAQLQLAASAAGRDLDAAREDEKQAGALLAGAVLAERESAGGLADAEQVHQGAWRKAEAARRLRKGARAETDAEVELAAAAKVLGRHQADHGALVSARDQAQRDVADASAAAAGREDEAARLAYAAEHVIRAPMSREAVFADVFALAAKAGVGALDGEDRLMVMGAVKMMAMSTGVDEDTRRDEADRVRARDEAEKRRQPQLLPGGDGMLVASVPTPTGPLPDGGIVNPPPEFGGPSPWADTFGPGASVSPGIPGGGQVTKAYEANGWWQAYMRPSWMAG